MRTGLAGLAIACVLLSSCNENAGTSADNGSSTEKPAGSTEKPASNEPVVENLPPRDEGYAIEAPTALVNAPTVTVDAGYTGKDKEDLEAYARAAVESLSSAVTANHATALNATYPKVWLNGVTKYEGLGSVGALARSPRSGFAYMPARLVLASSGTGAFESRDPKSRTGGRLITVRAYHLRWWRSTNPVRRSCAINTLAHEITHNMTRDLKIFRWAFTDTGLGNSVAGEKGSYAMGALAQCSYLQSTGQIAAEDVGRCLPLWGLKNAFKTDYCDTAPSKWPKG